MKRSPLDTLIFWAKPVITTILGIVLLLHPSSVTKVAGIVIGLAVAAIGAGLILDRFFGASRSFYRMCAGIILLCIGYSIIQSPLLLATRLSRFIGIFLVLESLRELTASYPFRSRSLSATLGIIGVVLILVPMSAHWLLSVGLGLLVLLLGLGMLADRLYSRRHPPEPDPANIIDAL